MSLLFFSILSLTRVASQCGKMPFARISSEWSHENQTVPDEVAKKLRRRGDSSPSVRGISLDTEFGKIDPKQ